MFDRTRALVAEPTNHDTPSPVLGSSVRLNPWFGTILAVDSISQTIVTSTTPSRLADVVHPFPPHASSTLTSQHLDDPHH